MNVVVIRIHQQWSEETGMETKKKNITSVKTICKDTDLYIEYILEIL